MRFAYYVGGRVRMRRIEVNMAQQILGGHIGLTFQQIQKYEKGTNRIGASRLQQIGRVLEVPASYFFEGAPADGRLARVAGRRTHFSNCSAQGTDSCLSCHFPKL